MALRSLCTHFRHAGRARYTPRIERLEDRIAPANNIVTFFLGGTLTITTVDDLSEAAVLTGDNDQNFQILAAGPGNVTLHKNGATNINGGVADVPFIGVVNIVIDVKEGDDFVVLKGGVNIPGDVTFKGGDGNNTFNLDGDVAGATSLRNLSITNGDGVDNIAFLETTTTLSGKLTINTGAGGSNMNIGFQQADNVTIAGAVSITAGPGADNLNFNGNDLLLKGAVSVRLGADNNSVRFAYQNSAVLEKPITVVNGAGNSVFEVSNTNKTSTFAAIKVTNSAGNSRVTFNGSVSDTIVGDMTVTNGAGNNRFEVDTAGAFAVGGKVKVTNGAGNSTTTMTPTGTNTVTGGFMLINLAGNDTTTIGGTDVTFKSLTLRNGNGDSTTSLSGTNLSYGSISSTSGDGADTFSVTAGNKFEIVTGGLTLKQGNGTTNTTIGAAGTGAIAGVLSITNGDGADTQIIAGAGNLSGLHSVVIANGRGGSTTTFDPAQITIAGSVSVTSGEGFDVFRMGNGALTNFNISGAIKLSHGPGGSNAQLNPTSNGNLSGAFTVTAADGNDKVDVIRTVFGGAMTLTLGAGNDEIEIDNSIVAALKFLTGSGNDIVEIEATTNDTVSTTILGAVIVDLGSGDDTLDWGFDANDVVIANQSVKLLGGLGLDRFDQNAATNAFVLPPTLTSLEVQLP